MQIRDLSKPVTSKALNESLAKKFGYKLNLEQFSDVQLEDARNKLRTKISQFEVSESYDGMNSSPEYQKVRLMLDCINTEIMEREEGMFEGNDGNLANNAKPYDKVTKGDVIAGRLGKDEMGGKKKKKKMESLNLALMVKKAREHSVPTKWIESAIQRIQLGESDQEELVSELQIRYDISENTAHHIVYLKEGEQDKAEIIMATKDMVDQITGWLEDVAAMKSEHLLELLDSIRESLGSDVAQQYQDAVKPALEAIYTALESSRQGLSTGLSAVSGEAAPTMGAPAPGGDTGGMSDMGAPDAGGAPDMGAPAPGGDMGAPAPGGDMGAPAGREKRESVDYSRRLGILLNSKKK
jgi:hypothetical protein